MRFDDEWEVLGRVSNGDISFSIREDDKKGSCQINEITRESCSITFYTNRYAVKEKQSDTFFSSRVRFKVN